jgi:hypothetical protein
MKSGSDGHGTGIRRCNGHFGVPFAGFPQASIDDKGPVVIREELRVNPVYKIAGREEHGTTRKDC